MMSTSSSVLPTTPIGKQQVIDLKAGAILRENARKSVLFFGCPLSVVLVLIVLIKCLCISFWIIREHETFDFRCAAWNGGQPTDYMYRAKRSIAFEKSDPRKFSKIPDDDDDDNSKTDVINKKDKKKKPLYGRSTSPANDIISDAPKIDPRLDFGPLPPNFQRKIDSNHIPAVPPYEPDDDLPMTTMVTLTNTQIVQLSGEETGVVKMKTIRNRVEKVGSDEEQFIEIDIANAPRIYVSKIKSRHGGEEEEHFDLLKELKKDEEEKEKKKEKKKKGKGLKKAKKLTEAEKLLNNSTSTSVIPDTAVSRKPKGKGLKKSKKLNQKPKSDEEVTKQPRHLVGKSSSLSPTTPRPKSSWMNGVLDPQDPNFSNQGQIRGYPMQKASRKPSATTASPSEKDEDEEKLKLSESTRMMWDMDELKYTTFLAPKTTEQTKQVEEGVKEVIQEAHERSQKPMLKETFEEATTSTEKPLPGGMSKDQWEKKKEAFEAYTPPISLSDLQPSHSSHSGPAQAPQHIHFESASSTPSTPPAFHFIPPSSEAPYYVEINDADTETVYVSSVTPMYRPVFENMGHLESTTKSYDPLHLEMEIAKLKESSTCLARMAFDVWCLFVLFSTVPFIMGICVPRWSLFVLHIVFDFLFLVVGFVTSLTIAIMSSIMYFLIDEMTSDSLFEFLLVAFVIDIVLILYAIVVGIAYRCCCRLVDNSIKETSINYSVSSNGEAV